jgi:hypothetical protein
MLKYSFKQKINCSNLNQKIKVLIFKILKKLFNIKKLINKFFNSIKKFIYLNNKNFKEIFINQFILYNNIYIRI